MKEAIGDVDSLSNAVVEIIEFRHPPQDIYINTLGQMLIEEGNSYSPLDVKTMKIRDHHKITQMSIKSNTLNIFVVLKIKHS